MANYQPGDYVVVGYSTIAKILSYDVENNRISYETRAGGNDGANRIEAALSHTVIEGLETLVPELLHERPAGHGTQQVDVENKLNPNAS